MLFLAFLGLHLHSFEHMSFYIDVLKLHVLRKTWGPPRKGFIFQPHETRQANKQTVCSMVFCDLARSHHMNPTTHRVHVF